MQCVRDMDPEKLGDNIKVRCLDVVETRNDTRYNVKVELSVEIKIRGTWYGEYRNYGQVLNEDRYKALDTAKFIALQTGLRKIEARASSAAAESRK